MGKVFISDYLKQHEGTPEEELAKDTVIRFEIGESKFQISIDGERLSVYKVNHGLNGGEISVFPKGANIIEIK